jgi:hypothetical protein
VYVSTGDLDKNCLRQGDILDAVPFPIIDVDVAVLGKIDAEAGMQIPHPKIVTIPREHRAQQDCFTMQVKTRLAPGAVISHCCELELRNGKCLLPMIALARIVPMKASIIGHAQKLASLRGNKDPRDPHDHGYLDYFYLAEDQSLGGIESVVDFSQVSSIPGSEYSSLLSRKVLQLLDRDRVKFKIKLAAYVGRLTDEESTAGLENPWQV